MPNLSWFIVFIHCSCFIVFVHCRFIVFVHALVSLTDSIVLSIFRGRRGRGYPRATDRQADGLTDGRTFWVGGRAGWAGWPACSLAGWAFMSSLPGHRHACYSSSLEAYLNPICLKINYLLRATSPPWS